MKGCLADCCGLMLVKWHSREEGRWGFLVCGGLFDTWVCRGSKNGGSLATYDNKHGSEGVQVVGKAFSQGITDVELVLVEPPTVCGQSGPDTEGHN